MGVPRSNSPTTASEPAVEEVKKDLREIHHDVETEPSKQEDDLEMGSSSSPRRLKDELKAMLSSKGSRAKDEDIADIVGKLSKFNPSKDVLNLDLLKGDFATLSIPPFPGRIEPTKGREDVVQYTLGRLSFNIFQPNELVCTVKSIENQVHPQHNEQGDSGRDTPVFSYDIVVELIIHTPDGDLDATLMNKASCWENEKKNDRLSVSFSGGSLIPGKETYKDSTMLAVWEKTFANAYERAKEERTILGWFYHYCLVFFLGLTLPSDPKHLDCSRDKNSFHFDIGRSPKGFLDVLYMDEDMRITKGNRGTITVVERVSSSGLSQ